MALTGCLIALSLIAAAEPADKAPPHTLMTRPGKLLFEEPMDKPPAKPWLVSKGKWELKDGSWYATVIPAENHGPTIRHSLPASDAILELQVRFTDLKNIHISFNDDVGHVSRVMIVPSGLVVRKDSYGHKNDKNLMVVPTAPAPNEWHTLTIETHGDEMVAQLDGVVSYGKHPDIAKKKTQLAIGLGSGENQVRGLRIYEAQPDPQWEARRKEIPARAPKAK